MAQISPTGIESEETFSSESWVGLKADYTGGILAAWGGVNVVDLDALKAEPRGQNPPPGHVG